MIRGIITACVEGVIKRFTASGRPDETISDREYIQHYGFSSRPLPGAEVIILREGGLFVAVASDDRRYRIALEEGEVALYDDLGQKVHFKRDRSIEVSGCQNLNIACDLATTVTAPLINLGGARSGLKALIDERVIALFNAHTHGGVQAGGASTGAPNNGTLSTANCATTKTKAG